MTINIEIDHINDIKLFIRANLLFKQILPYIHIPINDTPKMHFYVKSLDFIKETFKNLKRPR